MNKLTFAGLFMAALATSCSNDLGFDGRHTVQLDASVSAEQTRAAFLANGSFYWQDGDQIGVITVGNENAASETFSALALKSGAKTGSATFEGTITGEIGSYAIYPYDAAQKLSSNTLTYTFPKEYKYEKVDQTFFPSSQDGNSFNPAMLAKIEGNSVAFKHLGGVFCIDVESMPCTAGTITLTTNQKLCGEFTTSVTDATPELKTTDATVSTDNTVTIEFSGATQDQEGVFYIPAPTGVYTDAKVTITPTGSGKTTEVYAGKYTMDRTNLYRLALKKVTISATTETTTDNASGVESALGSSDNVAVTGTVSGTAEISIPATTTSSGSSSSTSAKTVTLQKVADDANITISDKNNSTSSEDASKSVQNLTVSVPNNATNAPSMTITMPNTTVTLAGNAGTATFKKVTASTAENTLVVTNGVTIDELVVEKGNVRVNSGATVNKITVADGKSAIIYYEEGANLPTSITGTYTKKGIIETEAQFAAAVTKGGDYALLKDVTIKDYKKTAGVKIDIDLNKHTLYMDLAIIAKDKGELTIKNGNITQLEQKADDDGGLIVESNSKLTIEDVNYTGVKDTWDCIFVRGHAQKAVVVVKNSKIKGGTYAITSNASENPIAKDCEITLENSSFDADMSGALLNIPATVKMTNCTFSGTKHGAVFRGGTYTVAGCDFTLNATLASSDSDNKWLEKWESGNACAFAALTIGNYIHTAYKYETKVTFETYKDGENDKKNTATVTGTYASSYPAIHACAANNYHVSITGLKDNVTTSGGKSPAIEYGTTDITVDGTDITDDQVTKKPTTSASPRRF